MKYRKMQQSKFGLPVTATGSTQKKMCGIIYAYSCNMWMMFVCGSIIALTYKYICVFDHTCVNVYVCVDMFICVYICKYVNVRLVYFTNHYLLIVCYQQCINWKRI